MNRGDDDTNTQGQNEHYEPPVPVGFEPVDDCPAPAASPRGYT